jgi:hypothetical protein
MMKIENSPAYEARMKKLQKDEEAKSWRHARAVSIAWRKCWGKQCIPWQPIETCPFEAYDEMYGLEGCILVKAGKKCARVSVTRRFGTPLVWTGKTPPETVMRDGRMVIEGDGKYVKPKRPAWWFQWELTDEDGIMTYAGGAETGKEEIDFLPTHWLPLPVRP